MWCAARSRRAGIVDRRRTRSNYAVSRLGSDRGVTRRGTGKARALRRRQKAAHRGRCARHHGRRVRAAHGRSAAMRRARAITRAAGHGTLERLWAAGTRRRRAARGDGPFPAPDGGARPQSTRAATLDGRDEAAASAGAFFARASFKAQVSRWHGRARRRWIISTRPRRLRTTACRRSRTARFQRAAMTKGPR